MHRRGYAPCIPGDGTLPANVVVDPRGKIAHNVSTNWGPRLGLSYRWGQKTVVHAGYGIVYDNWAAVSQMAQNIEGAWPDIGQLIANNLNVPSSTSAIPTATVQDPFAASGSGLFPAPTPFNQVQWFYDPNIKNAYAEQYNFGVQRQLNSSTALTVNYVGSQSHRVVVGGYYNTALTPGPGDPQARALYPYIGPTFYDRSNGNASYNAAQLQLERRASGGLTYSVGYTYSKFINEGGDGWFGAEGGVPVDPYQPAKFGSRSVAGTDLTHVFTENTIYQIPVGKGKRWSTGNSVADYILGNWQLNNFFTMRSGLPFTPLYTTGDQANTGNVGWAGYEHANLVGDPHKTFPKGMDSIPRLMRFRRSIPTAQPVATRCVRHDSSIWTFRFSASSLCGERDEDSNSGPKPSTCSTTAFPARPTATWAAPPHSGQSPARTIRQDKCNSAESSFSSRDMNQNATGPSRESESGLSFFKQEVGSSLRA